MQRDMEKEGKEYGDKDTFLTSAYRQKLKERKKMEEELKQEEKKDGKGCGLSVEWWAVVQILLTFRATLNREIFHISY